MNFYLQVIVSQYFQTFPTVASKDLDLHRDIFLKPLEMDQLSKQELHPSLDYVFFMFYKVSDFDLLTSTNCWPPQNRTCLLCLLRWIFIRVKSIQLGFCSYVHKIWKDFHFIWPQMTLTDFNRVLVLTKGGLQTKDEVQPNRPSRVIVITRFFRVWPLLTSWNRIILCSNFLWHFGDSELCLS